MKKLLIKLQCLWLGHRWSMFARGDLTIWDFKTFRCERCHKIVVDPK